MTCYPDLEPEVVAVGGREFVNRDVVVDGSLVTVRGLARQRPLDARVREDSQKQSAR